MTYLKRGSVSIVAILLLGMVILGLQQRVDAYSSVNITSVSVVGQSAQYMVNVQVSGTLFPLSLDYTCGGWACDEGQWQLRDGGGATVTSANAGYFQSGDYSHTFNGVDFRTFTQGCFADIGNGGGASDCATASITDTDNDGWVNAYDNCPTVSNPSQADSNNNGTGDACEAPDADNDGVPDASDNCPNTPNPGQEDADGDGIGDVCDSTPNGDNDNDGVDNLSDNCPNTPNPGQEDADGDGIGDVCDLTPNGDDDNDGVDNLSDNCPTTANPGQEDGDGDGIGDVCDPTPNGDDDNDGVDNLSDNCPSVGNPGQEDADGDGTGDACDLTPNGDDDNDGVDNASDNCPLVVNPGQEDGDGDGIGDVCDLTPTGDTDGDGVDNAADNCPTTPNPSQGDADSDGVGDVCDATPISPPDDRLNWKHGDLTAVVYSRGGGVHIYCVDGESQGHFVLQITQTMVDNADPGQPQDMPIKMVIESGCKVGFYALDSGMFQINIWGAENKLYEILADNIAFKNHILRHYDPNE